MLRFLRLIRVFQEDILFLVLPEFFPWLNYIPAPLMRKLSKKDWLQKSAKETNDTMQVGKQWGGGAGWGDCMKRGPAFGSAFPPSRLRLEAAVNVYLCITV